MKSPRWSLIRAAGQILFFAGFIALIITLRFPVEETWLYGLVTRFSLHLGIAASISSRTFLTLFFPGLILVLLAIPMGRYFCGWICPMGATIDTVDKAIAPANRKSGNRRIKYVILIISLATAAAGLQISGVLDPLSMAARSYIVLYSYFDSLFKMGLGALIDAPGIGRTADSILTSMKDVILDMNDIRFHHHWMVTVFFIAALGLSFFARRFWCRYLCPLGACHALAAGISLSRRTVDTNACTKCRACERSCRMGAIYGDGMLTHETECIRCFQCLRECRCDAISFGFSLPWRKTAVSNEGGARPRSGMTRRELAAAVASSALAVPFIKSNAGAENSSTYLIRPPGAGPENVFLDRCIRCGLCMKVCPTNGLHPAIAEAGMEGIFTPRLVPRIGWCENNCNLCTLICPTGALRPVAIEERETLMLGTAVIIRDLCIPWSEGRNCIVCEEMCPTATKSIKFIEENGSLADGTRMTLKKPYVLNNICIGCGICENKCPVRGSAAIRVRRKKDELKKDNS